MQVAVPSILELWLPQLMQHRSHLSLQQLVSSGEGLTVALAAQLLEALPTGCCLVNLYGKDWKHAEGKACKSISVLYAKWRCSKISIVAVVCRLVSRLMHLCRIHPHYRSRMAGWIVLA